jgi:hypothetical protein
MYLHRVDIPFGAGSYKVIPDDGQRQPERDAIARVINPIAFTALERSYVVPAPEEFMDMRIAREKADKILALFASSPSSTEGK